MPRGEVRAAPARPAPARPPRGRASTRSAMPPTRERSCWVCSPGRNRRATTRAGSGSSRTDSRCARTCFTGARRPAAPAARSPPAGPESIPRPVLVATGRFQVVVPGPGGRVVHAVAASLSPKNQRWASSTPVSHAGSSVTRWAVAQAARWRRSRSAAGRTRRRPRPDRDRPPGSPTAGHPAPRCASGNVSSSRPASTSSSRGPGDQQGLGQGGVRVGQPRSGHTHPGAAGCRPRVCARCSSRARAAGSARPDPQQLGRAERGERRRAVIRGPPLGGDPEPGQGTGSPARGGRRRGRHAQAPQGPAPPVTQSGVVGPPPLRVHPAAAGPVGTQRGQHEREVACAGAAPPVRDAVPGW